MMNETIYGMMAEAFRPYIICIIIGLVLIIGLLVFLLNEKRKTNQILSGMIDQFAIFAILLDEARTTNRLLESFTDLPDNGDQ